MFQAGTTFDIPTVSFLCKVCTIIARSLQTSVFIMAGVKRKSEEMAGDAAVSSEVTRSPFLPVFEDFQAELDEHHDRRERITKASRDVTAQSKKM